MRSSGTLPKLASCNTMESLLKSVVFEPIRLFVCLVRFRFILPMNRVSMLKTHVYCNGWMDGWIDKMAVHMGS